ncbi:MAG: alpha/beta hydrolase [Myxococcota bacterium]
MPASFASWLELRRARAGASVLDLRPSLARRLAGPPRVDEAPLDPNLQLLFRVQALAGEGSFADQGGVAEARHFYRVASRHVFALPEPPVAHTADREIPGPGGPIPVRIYRPADTAPLPVIVYLHGGGFCVGDLETHDPLCRRLARDVHALVVSVDYRLAPEHPAPAGVEDAIAALGWVAQHAAELGGDPARVAVAGDSAGACLACVATQEVPVHFQLLFYPVAESYADTASRARFAEDHGLTRADVEFFSAHHLGGFDPADPRVAPLRSPNLARCPPTRVIVAGFDVLRDEGRALGEALRRAGVDATTVTMGSLAHGFAQMTRVAACRDGLEDGIAALRRAFEAPA